MRRESAAIARVCLLREKCYAGMPAIESRCAEERHVYVLAASAMRMFYRA